MARILLDGLAVAALVAAGAWLVLQQATSTGNYDAASPWELTEALSDASVRPSNAALHRETVTLNGTSRPAVVVQAPARIDLRPDWVPWSSLRVSIGVRRPDGGDVDAEGTVGFEISATDQKTKERTIARKHVRLRRGERASGWRELELDLGPLRGRPLLLRFWARGDDGLEACWGDPVLTDVPARSG